MSRSALWLPGVATDFVSSPDVAGWTPTTSLDVRALVALDDWTPAGTMAIASHYAGSGDQRGWSVQALSTGRIRFTWTTDGTAGTLGTEDSTLHGFTDGSVHAIRVVWIPSTSITFYVGGAGHSLGDSGWEVIHQITAGVPATIHNSTALLNLGRITASTPMAGKFYKVRIIVDGVTVGDPDFSRPVGPRHIDSVGKLWTLNGTGSKWMEA